MPRSPLKIFLTLTLVLFCVLAGSLLLGSLSLAELWHMWQQHDPTWLTIILELRLPRALAALFCGALLALAGGLMQVQLRNPLADPYVLGTAGGAALGGLLALLCLGHGWLAPGAGVGALFSLVALMLITFRQRNLDHGADTTVTLLLIGVMLSALLGALVSLLLTLAPTIALRGLIFWLLGDLSGAQVAWWLWGVASLITLGALRLARDLTLLSHGATLAYSLGVDVTRRRWQVIVLAACATAAAVTVGGTIGFIGLVVPHLMRRWVGNEQRLLLPSAMLAGATLLLLCDTLARSIAAPTQLPVGVVTALLGAPLFIFLLLRGVSTRHVM